MRWAPAAARCDIINCARARARKKAGIVRAPRVGLINAKLTYIESTRVWVMMPLCPGMLHLVNFNPICIV